MRPVPDARLTVVSNFPLSTYSGMLPGTLAGLYPPQRMQIDLVRLCAAAGARFIQADVTGLDLPNHALLFADRPPLPFDALSIGVGSRPRGDDVYRASEAVVAIKPMQTFLHRLDRRLIAWSRLGHPPLRVAVVGAGAGGVEIAFCLPPHVRRLLGDLPLELTLIDHNRQILSAAPASTRRLALEELARRGVRLLTSRHVQRYQAPRLVFTEGEPLEADLVLWATSAEAQQVAAALGLPADEDGFLLTTHTLQSIADSAVFVVGDAGTIQGAPTPKAGVYAVRQGPVLWENLRRYLDGRPLLAYQPQRGFLSLLATGDGRAILSYKGFSFRGRWCWKLKDYIDGRFIDKYQNYQPPLMPAGPPSAATPNEVRCAGCGGKVAGSVLRQVLARLNVPPSPHVAVGLAQPDDAAVVLPPGGRPIVATVDFFAAFLDDPYLVGRIAALNALSDVYALGATPLAAMAIATLPPGPQPMQQQLLYELLAGGLHELKAAGATLIGGHTIEGPQLSIGYSVLADGGHTQARLKGGLRAGDTLLLTRPLGSGILLAAHMRAMCRAEWIEPLLAAMLTSNRAAAALADEFDIQGITDITGFGLAGHLLEMLEASNLAAELHLADVPLLPGVEPLVSAGIASTLAPANRAAEAQIQATPAQQQTPHYAALFDPQTSGGLLLGVPSVHVQSVLARLADQGTPAAVIGRACAGSPGTPPIRLL